MPIYRVGAVVELLSGGPEMTVNRSDLNGRWIECSWFAGKKLMTARFRPETVRPSLRRKKS